MPSRSSGAILVPTCDKHAWAARLNSRLTNQFWENHPPVWFCGAPSGENSSWLPLRRNSADWLGILEDAAARLSAASMEWAYVILDDQIPVGPCNSAYLNDICPDLVTSHGIDRVALFGGGQFQPRDGRLTRIRGYAYEIPSRSCDWLFCLHPALWRLDALRLHLAEMRSQNGPGPVSAWEYERLAAEGLRRGAFQGARHLRVIGMSAAKPGTEPPLLRLFGLAAMLIRLASRTAGAAGLSAVAKTIQRRGHSFAKYYHGPYPYFWSGVMLRGRIQSDWLKWLALNGRRSLAEAVLDAAPR